MIKYINHFYKHAFSPISFFKFFTVFGLIFFIAGCTAGDPKFNAENLAGFWVGLWHGMISAFTLIIGIFYDSVRIYEVNNTGGWYDFGFLFGVTSIWGGACKGASLNRKKSCIEDAEWKDIEEKLEKKFYEKCKQWANEEGDTEWEDIAKKVEKKVKRKVKEWAEKD
ncbi:MAG: hypothetical protein OEZ13_05360 [Spirochaetia bacterium]|nr:hypothetical protein [Spirochaetia bacterium]